MPNRAKPLLQPEHSTLPSAASNRDTVGAFIANETGVAANAAPTLANPIANQAATEDSAYSFQFNTNVFGDAGDTLSYTASLSSGAPLPGWLTFTPGTRTFAGTPLTANIGTITIRLTATDSLGQSISDEFDLVVSAA